MNYSVLITQMLQASVMTLRIFFVTLVFSLPLGLVVALGRMSKIKAVNIPVRIYILIMRGTPLMLQLLFIFYGFKPILGIQLERVLSAEVALLCGLFRRDFPRRHSICAAGPARSR